MGGNSAFGQVFNPSWIDGSPDGKVKPGLIVRTQNCTVGYEPPLSCGLGGKGDPEHGKGSTNHSCCACNMRSVNDSLQKRSILTFARLEGDDGSQTKSPKFTPLTSQSIVFEPVDDPPLNDDFKGTEDPRVAMDPKTGIYYMFYVRAVVLELALDLDLATVQRAIFLADKRVCAMQTCFHKGTYSDGAGGSLCLASTKDPSSSTSWTRHGTAFPGNHKSGALLIRDSPPHYLISGAGEIHIAKSDDLLKWELGPLFINDTAWGNPNVEAGPPPMKLSDGNYVFFHNSWGGEGVPQPGYQPAWVILDGAPDRGYAISVRLLRCSTDPLMCAGTDPTHILARAPAPLWRPDYFPWMAGDTSPDTVCNVPQVSFLEAAHPVADKPDTFRLYYGGSDAVVGTAVVTFEKVQGVSCLP